MKEQLIKLLESYGFSRKDIVKNIDKWVLYLMIVIILANVMEVVGIVIGVDFSYMIVNLLISVIEIFRFVAKLPLFLYCFFEWISCYIPTSIIMESYMYFNYPEVYSWMMGKEMARAAILESAVFDLIEEVLILPIDTLFSYFVHVYSCACSLFEGPIQETIGSGTTTKSLPTEQVILEAYLEYTINSLLVLQEKIKLDILACVLNIFGYGARILEFFSFLIPLLICVALLTLVERKILAAIQRRQGPQIVGFYGLLQPFADGLKLFAKEGVIPTMSNYYLFMIAPILALFLSFLLWVVIPIDFGYSIVDIDLAMLFILGISSLAVYGIIIAGWSSNSKYAFLGALRSAAQMISYEVSLGLIIMPIFAMTESFNLLEVLYEQSNGGWNILFFFPLGILFFLSALAETNRSPFDLPEAEAELVSGYNVEYSGFGFAFFFIAEYLNIIFMCFLFSILFLGGPLSLFLTNSNIMWFIVKVWAMLWLFVGVRAIVPRYRYDQLMYLGWKNFLPLSLFFIIFYYTLLIGSII